MAELSEPMGTWARLPTSVQALGTSRNDYAAR